MKSKPHNYEKANNPHTSTVTLNIFAQESSEQDTDLELAVSIQNNEIEAFAPNRKLLNAELWKKVSVNRFECGFVDNELCCKCTTK